MKWAVLILMSLCFAVPAFADHDVKEDTQDCKAKFDEAAASAVTNINQAIAVLNAAKGDVGTMKVTNAQMLACAIECCGYWSAECQKWCDKYDQASEECKKAKERIAELSKEISELKGELARTKSERDQFKQKSESLALAMAEMKGAIKMLIDAEAARSQALKVLAEYVQ